MSGPGSYGLCSGNSPVEYVPEPESCGLCVGNSQVENVLRSGSCAPCTYGGIAGSALGFDS